MFRFGSIGHPQSKFNINKGSVRVVKSESEDFKVRYDDSLRDHIEVRSTADTVVVRVAEEVQNAHIEVNVAGLSRCEVGLKAGNLSTNTTCAQSKFMVQSGTIDASLDKAELGKVSAAVNTGQLSNTSDLAPATTSTGHNHATGFFSAAYSHWPIPGMVQSIALVGDLGADYSTAFEVSCGMINLHN